MAKPKTAAEFKAHVAGLITRKQALLDGMDDQLMGMPEMAPDAPLDMATSPEFDLLTQKRDELEQEIQHMREGVQLIGEWEKFKGGPWSEEIKSMLSGMDSNIADAAGGEPAAPLGMPAAPLAPPAPDLGAPAPAAPLAPEAPAAPEIPPAPIGGEGTGDTLSTPEAPAPDAAPPALEPPLASQKSATSKKNNYQVPLKKGVSARSDMKKEGSTMANQTATKPANLKEKLAEAKQKREAIKREAQIRTAAAYTIANTMLPTAPVEKRQAFAASLLQGNDTKSLVAALRQTAKNAHYTHVAEQFKEVHKVEMNDLLEDPSVLKSERSAVEKEIKGDAKSAAVPAAKKADDRKDAGPQEGTYDDGRKGSEPKEIDASKAAERPDAGEKPGQTINLSDGKSASAKKAEECKCEGECKCAASKKAVDQKIADEPALDAPAAPNAPEAPALDAAPAGDAPIGDAPAGDAGAPPEEAAGAILTDEKKMVVQEKIEEAEEAIKALEQEILEENDEEPALPMEGEEEISLEEGEPAEGELDLNSIFDEGSMDDKVSALANEGDEHMAAEDFFAPTSAAAMESALEDSGMQVASIEDYFSVQGSDNDPLASLIASSNEKTAASVEGFDVIESFSNAAYHFKQDEAGSDDRTNESDHDEDLFAEAMKDIKPEEQGAKRTPQDAVPELQTPKQASAPKKASDKGSIKRVRPVVAGSKVSGTDIATALFGSEE